VSEYRAEQKPIAPVTAPPGAGGGDVDITFVVACYNEEENIIDTLDTLRAALAEVHWTWEIIVVDDASTDRSVELVRAYLDSHPDLPIILKVNEHNRGLAFNYVETAFLGRGQYYRLVCGDNVEPKEAFVAVLKDLGTADMILTYHTHCEGKSRLRMLLSRTYTWLVNTVSGHRMRYYNGLAIHSRYNVMRWHPYCRGFGFQAELITRLLDEGYSYREVLVVPHERTKGKAKAMTLMNFLSVGHTLLDMLIRRVSNWVHRRRSVGTAARKAVPCAARPSDALRTDPPHPEATRTGTHPPETTRVRG
jgi:glycosyltransferase involved in cell wall biosynthesis